MGRGEVADLLGVTKQRVNQLSTTAQWKKLVPTMQRLKMGPVFLADEVRAFQAAWTRKPGRPKKETP